MVAIDSTDHHRFYAENKLKNGLVPREICYEVFQNTNAVPKIKNS